MRFVIHYHTLIHACINTTYKQTQGSERLFYIPSFSWINSRKLISATNTSAVCTALLKFTPACLPTKEQLAHLHLSPSVTVFKSCALSIRSWIPMSCLRVPFVNFLEKHLQETQELKSNFGHSHMPMAADTITFWKHLKPVSKWQREHLDAEAFYTSVYLEFCRGPYISVYSRCVYWRQY